MEKDNREVLLRVKHLKQYFKFGSGEYKYNKAVHDVSFDVHRGEVFGLVGESGCGKTTTGRSIIKLYDITSGDIYFKGVRVSAGTRWNEKEIKFTLIRMREAISKLKLEMKEEIANVSLEIDGEESDFSLASLQKVENDIAQEKHNTSLAISELKAECIEKTRDTRNECGDDTALFEDKKAEIRHKFDKKIESLKVASHKRLEVLKEQHSKLMIEKAKAENAYKGKVAEIKAKYNAKISEVKKDAYEIVSRERNNIRQAHYDTKHCNDIYRETEIKKVQDEYLPKVEAAEAKLKEFDKTTDVEKYNAALAEFKDIKTEYKTHLKLAKNARLMTQIQMIFQDPIASLDPRMTVKEIIAEGFRIKGINDNKFINKKVEEVLKLVGLVPEHASRYPHEFSGGQRQRIGIARAMVMDPELIIADEPISALDVSIQAQVINLLNNLKETLGLTILFIAHDLSVVKYFCDRIGVMYFGQMVELTTSDELFKHPLHPYTKSLLSAIPHPDPNFEKNRVKINYNPNTAHDYSNQKPTMREVIPGHFVYCNDEELERYKKEISEIDKKNK